MRYTSDRKSVDIDGREIAYYREGSGETVLFVHGITTYSFIWRNIFPAFTQNYDAIMVDLLGCGDSDKSLDADFSLKAQSEMLRGFLKALGIDKVHFVGHDVGGGVAQIFAVNYPEALHDVTVINTVAYDFWPVQPIIAMRTPIIRQFAMATLDLGALNVIVKRGLHYKKNLSSELEQYFKKPMNTSAGRKAFLKFAKSLNNQNLLEISEKLTKLEVPMLIIRGDSDVYLSKEIALELHRNIPGSRLAVIEDGGHFIQEDVPQKVINEILSFYESNSDAG